MIRSDDSDNDFDYSVCCMCQTGLQFLQYSCKRLCRMFVLKAGCVGGVHGGTLVTACLLFNLCSDQRGFTCIYIYTKQLVVISEIFLVEQLCEDGISM